MKPKQKYEITWIDITHDNDWISFDEVDKKILSAEGGRN